MREYEFNESMRGNSPHMVYQSIHPEVPEKQYFSQEKTNLLQTIMNRVFSKENFDISPSKPSNT
jgi:hypothetical protein